ncbi:unnamed protein product [Laminaria digitata]
MVDVCTRRCSYDSCSFCPSFNVVGSKKPEYCKQHAENGMVDVRRKRCAHDSCMGWPRWGLVSEGSASACASHRSDLPAGRVIDFKAPCKGAGCQKMSRWGLEGKQPTHCPDHSHLKDGLVRTVGKGRGKMVSGSPSYHAVRGHSSRVKIEFAF